MGEEQSRVRVGASTLTDEGEALEEAFAQLDLPASPKLLVEMAAPR